MLMYLRIGKILTELFIFAVLAVISVRDRFQLLIDRDRRNFKRSSARGVTIMMIVMIYLFI